MPLDGQDPSCSGSCFQRFDQSVRTSSHGHKYRRDLVRRLVVDGHACIQPAGRTQGAGQSTPWFDGNIVHAGSATCLRSAMAMKARGRQVLVQRPPERHVEDLQAAANCEQGETGVHRVASQGELELVAFLLDPIHVGVPIGRVAQRVDVTATEKRQSCERLEHLLRASGLRWRQHRRPDAGTAQGVHILARDGFGTVLPTGDPPGPQVIRRHGNKRVPSPRHTQAHYAGTSEIRRTDRSGLPQSRRDSPPYKGL